jgi:hypothetical protein
MERSSRGLMGQESRYLLFALVISLIWGHAIEYVVEALCYKAEGRGFESRRDHWISQLT